jgi:hypothetical protein
VEKGFTPKARRCQGENREGRRKRIADTLLVATLLEHGVEELNHL